MTPCEAFKLGFFERCADDGCTGAEIDARIEKMAALLGVKAAGWESLALAPALGAVNGLTSLPGKALELTAELGVPAALAAPLAVGGGIGYGLNRLTDSNGGDVDDVKRDELIDEYRRQAALSRQTTLARKSTHQQRSRRF